jgi:hypothetical protein
VLLAGARESRLLPRAWPPGTGRFQISLPAIGLPRIGLLAIGPSGVWPPAARGGESAGVMVLAWMGCFSKTLPEGDAPEGDVPERDMLDGDWPDGGWPEGDCPEGDWLAGERPDRTVGGAGRVVTGRPAAEPQTESAG